MPKRPQSTRRTALEGMFLQAKPGLWARWQMRWRIWRRDPSLMQSIAHAALQRCGVCDDSDSLVRIARDRDTGHLVVMIYLAHFDHAVWAMSRHIESYLVRQFKGLYNVPVHSVHLGVIRARAFKEMPPIKSASSLRAVLRERRAAGIRSTGTTGRKIPISRPAPLEAGDGFAKTAQAGLDDAPLSSASAAAAAPSAPGALAWPSSRSRQVADWEEYLSVPGYEVSEVNFEEFLSSLPPDSGLPAGVSESRPLPAAPPAAAGRPQPAPGTPFVAEADLMKNKGP